MAQNYYIEYLKLIDHYGQLNPETRQIWKNFEKNDKYRPNRDDKIAEYKKNKDLQMKIKVKS